MSKWQIAASSFLVIVLVVVGLLFWKHRVDVAAQRAQAQARLDMLVKQQAQIANLESRFGTEVDLQNQKAKNAATASQARKAASDALPLGTYQVNVGSAAANEYETMVTKAKQELNDVNAMYVDVRNERSTLSELAYAFTDVLGDGPVNNFRATSGQYTQDQDFELNRWLRGITDISDDIKYNGKFTTENIEQLYRETEDYVSRARTQHAQLTYQKDELDKEIQARVDKARSYLAALGRSVSPTSTQTLSRTWPVLQAGKQQAKREKILTLGGLRVHTHRDSAVANLSPSAPTETPTLTPAATPLDPDQALFVAANVGDYATIKSGPIQCFDSPEVMSADQQTSGDVDTNVKAAARIRFLWPGSRFTITDESDSPVYALRVRIVSGDKTGLACWISGTLPVKYFTHLASR
jgi:hypothetical protein